MGSREVWYLIFLPNFSNRTMTPGLEEKRLEEVEKRLEAKGKKIVYAAGILKKKLTEWNSRKRKKDSDLELSDIDFGELDTSEFEEHPWAKGSSSKRAKDKIRAGAPEEEIEVLRARDAEWIEKEAQWIDEKKRLWDEIAASSTVAVSYGSSGKDDLIQHLKAELVSVKKGCRDLKIKYDVTLGKLRNSKRDLAVARRTLVRKEKDDASKKPEKEDVPQKRRKIDMTKIV